MANMYNYLFPMVYPPYGYPGFPMPNNGYYATVGPWRDSMVSNPNGSAEINSYRNFYNPQTMRVNHRDTR